MAPFKGRPPGVFVVGVNASGKSTLVRALVEAGFVRVCADDVWRTVPSGSRAAELAGRFKFASDEAEASYLDSSTPESLWADIREQSVALWPYALRVTRSLLDGGVPVVLEGINMLPSLVVPTLGFGGMLLAIDDPTVIAARLAERPRWSKRPDLQRREAELLCGWVQPALRREAEQHGVAVTSNPVEARGFICRLAGL